MSARLTIGISSEHLEEASVDVVVVSYFDSDRPLRGAAGHADWRLCGQFTRLLISEKVSGAAGEATLLATGPGWEAPRVLGLGLGKEREFDAEAWELYARETVERIVRLRVADAAFPISGSHLGRLAIDERVGAVLRGAVAAFGTASIPLRLQLVVSGSEAEKAREAAAVFASRVSSAAVATEPGSVGGIATARPAPQGGAEKVSPSTQIFK